MYFKIITFLIVVMVMYYAVMIILDIRAQKAKAAAEAEKDSEVDIDISDEASTFKPTLISREEKAPVQSETQTENNPESTPASENQEELSEGEADFSEEKKPFQDSGILQPASAETPQEEKKPFRRPNYREAIMTGGYLVENLIEEIDKEAEDKDSDLAQIIHAWERA